MDIMEFTYIFKNLKSWFFNEIVYKLKNMVNIPPKCFIFVSFGILWRHIDACFIQKCLFAKFVFSPIIKILCFQLSTMNPYPHVFNKCLKWNLKCFRSFFCDKDSESRRSQFDQGIYPRLSQSSVGLSNTEDLSLMKNSNFVALLNTAVLKPYLKQQWWSTVEFSSDWGRVIMGHGLTGQTLQNTFAPCTLEHSLQCRQILHNTHETLTALHSILTGPGRWIYIHLIQICPS